MRLRAPALVSLLCLSGAATWATDTMPPSPTAGTATAAEASDAPAMESARASVRSAAEWLASGVDSWFGDKPFKDGGKVSDGRLSLTLLKRQDASVDINLRFNARFKLPNVEENTYVFFGRDNLAEVVSDQPAALSRQERLRSETKDDAAFFAGIGRTITDNVDFRLGFRGGLKPYVQGRYRKPWALGPDDSVEFRQTFFWSVDDRLGSTTALSYEHDFSPTLVGRWLNATTVTQKDNKFTWQSTAGVYKDFGNQRLLTLEALVVGKEGSGVASTDYGLQVKWAQLVHKDWLVMELVAGHFWPRPDAQSARGRAWALGAGLKMRF